MDEELGKSKFNWKSFRIWRTVQIAALLPLILSGVLLLYFKEPSPLGIMAFFLVLIVGVLLPQMRSDMILSHIVLTRELEERFQKFEERIVNLLDQRLAETQAQKSERQGPLSRPGA